MSCPETLKKPPPKGPSSTRWVGRLPKCPKEEDPLGTRIFSSGNTELTVFVPKEKGESGPQGPKKGN